MKFVLREPHFQTWFLWINRTKSFTEFNLFLAYVPMLLSLKTPEEEKLCTQVPIFFTPLESIFGQCHHFIPPKNARKPLAKKTFQGLWNDKSSRQRCSVEKGVLRYFAKLTGKHLYQSIFFKKVAGLRLRPATLLRKRLWHRCFPVSFAKFLRTSFYRTPLDGCHNVIINSWQS